MTKKAKKPAAKRTAKKRATPKYPSADSKAGKVLAAMKRPIGVTADELVKLTDWQPHTVRGFISGTVRKAPGLTVETKRDGGTTTYRIVETKK